MQSGSTSLMKATEAGHRELVTILIEHGANIAVKNNVLIYSSFSLLLPPFHKHIRFLL